MDFIITLIKKLHYQISQRYKKINLVLDLDETLIKSVIPMSNSHLSILRIKKFYLCDITINNVVYCIFSRPFLFYYLEKWSEKFNLYIYTQSAQEYCDIILEKFKELSSIKICGVCSRKSNTELVNKNLQNLGIDSNNTIIVDDNYKIWDEVDSIINIKPFFGPSDLSNKYIADTELIKVDKYLEIILDKYNEMILDKYQKPNLINLIIKSNEKYNLEPWIYDGFSFLTIKYIYDRGLQKTLMQPFFYPKLQKI